MIVSLREYVYQNDGNMQVLHGVWIIHLTHTGFILNLLVGIFFNLRSLKAIYIRNSNAIVLGDTSNQPFRLSNNAQTYHLFVMYRNWFDVTELARQAKITISLQIVIIHCVLHYHQVCYHSATGQKIGLILPRFAVNRKEFHL